MLQSGFGGYRLLLLIMGVLLLVFFGVKAASQATSLAAAGGEVRHGGIPLPVTTARLTSLAVSETPATIGGAQLQVNAKSNATSATSKSDNSPAISAKSLTVSSNNNSHATDTADAKAPPGQAKQD